MISMNRMERLQLLRQYIQEKLNQKKEVHLIFICVQNSRRSHLAQVFAHVSAYQHQLKNVHCYSGGVEVTRIHINTVETLRSYGFLVQQKSFTENPIYELVYHPQEKPIVLYSKSFEEITKVIPEFAAVLVCSESETNCPYVPGAERKILLPYDDPKIADDTDNPLQEYKRIAEQIKEEMNFVFSKVYQSVGH